jgi:hypothetical protein
MTFRRTLRTALALTGTLLVTVTVTVTAPAQAAPGDAVATGSAGAVHIKQDGGAPIVVDPIAPCATGGQAQGSSPSVAVQNVASFNESASTCTVDDAGELASVEVTGGSFRFDALRAHGGPRIRLANYTARCATTLTASSSSIQFSGLSGVDVPAELPANHVVTVPGADGAPPVAIITFNELIVPSPPDGSMTVNLMHIRMFPQGGPAAGDATVGTVHCAPVN